MMMHCAVLLCPFRLLGFAHRAKDSIWSASIGRCKGDEGGGSVSRLAESAVNLEAPRDVKTIPQEVIDQTWERIADMSEEQAQALASRMQKQQPFVMVYLLAADENWMAEDEPGRLMELGAIIWQIMSSVGKKLREVSSDELEAAEEANLRFLEKLDEEPQMNFTDSVMKMMADYNQMPLLGAVVEALMAGYEDTPELAPENIGMALLYLKTVIDCLDQ